MWPTIKASSKLVGRAPDAIPDNPGWGEGKKFSWWRSHFFFGGLCAPGYVAQVKKNDRSARKKFVAQSNKKNARQKKSAGQVQIKKLGAGDRKNNTRHTRAQRKRANETTATGKRPEPTPNANRRKGDAKPPRARNDQATGMATLRPAPISSPL